MLENEMFITWQMCDKGGLSLLSMHVVTTMRTMSKLFVLIALCHGLFGIKNVQSVEMELQCPSGYTINESTTYESEKEWNRGKSMTCMSCSMPSTPTNTFEVCTDVNGFTDPDPNPARFEYGDDRFRASPYHFKSNRNSSCEGLCGNGACSATVLKGETTLKLNKCDKLDSCAMPVNVSM